MTSIENVLCKLKKVRLCGRGYTALCPAHEDKRPSLSIGEGRDGQILLHCHAGCTIQQICDAIGIRVADLFVQTEGTNHHPGITGTGATRNGGKP